MKKCSKDHHVSKLLCAFVGEDDVDYLLDKETLVMIKTPKTVEEEDDDYAAADVVDEKCHLVRTQGMFVAMLLENMLTHEWSIVIKDKMMTGWTRRVLTRPHIVDMCWTPQGQLMAACGKTVFMVGGSNKLD